MPLPIVNGFRSRADQHGAFQPKRNGRRHAVVVWKTRNIPGATKVRRRSNISAPSGRVQGRLGTGVRMDTAFSILAITFTSGAWTGTPKATTHRRPREIQRVRRKGNSAFRVAAPGVTRSRLPGPPIAAACHRIFAIPTMV